jgi:uncharacterized protein (TIGR04255 family)
LTEIGSENLPEYSNPPVNEVVCGVHFERLSKLLNPYLGVLWEKYKPEYSKCREVAPLMPVIETFDETPKPVAQYVDVPPLPRTWFIHADDYGIIQVQRDRFLHNWRETRPEDAYPRYHRVIEMFREHLSTFRVFLEENDLGKIKPLQYELTYINHVMQGEGWNTISDLGEVFPNHNWQDRENGFLPLPDNINWQTSFVMPNRAGRLHTRIQNAVRLKDKHPLLRFELTARGIGEYSTLDMMWNWFDLAHEWIVLGFAELTDIQVQQNIWGRRS